MTTHSSIVGGSTAERILNCPGSFRAVQALPPSVTQEATNEYAAYGTFAHEVMADILTEVRASPLIPAISMASARLRIGHRFYDRVFTQEHLDEAIAPAIYGLEEINQRCGGDMRIATVESTIKFPGVAGAFGTADLLLYNSTYIVLVDFKFGTGVPVSATYPTDDGGEVVNAQLLFYLAGAMRKRPIWFRKKRIAIAILQPRLEYVSMTEVRRIEVRHFVEDVENAVVAALTPGAPLAKGRWCRFCPAKATCPKWTGPMQELITLMNAAPERTAATTEITPYAQFLAAAKQFGDLAVLYKKEIDDQLLAYLDNGGVVPGWRLKLRHKSRQWVDPPMVADALRSLGFEDAEIFQPPKLVTFQAANATARRLNVRIPEELRVAPPSTEVTLATEDDPAPVVERRLVVEQFRAALEDIQKCQMKT
jgi:hypothetical protein